MSPALAVESPSYLDHLNPEQRAAVEHGVTPLGHVGAPLLVIAGAGSGKTNTLAHRVAHLFVAGADPRRMLLLTFSRRAAAEMRARVERIARKVCPDQASLIAEALTWAGTFHGIGARLLRLHAEQIGLDPDFTIHDREDSADLMNLVRHDLGFDATRTRFPSKGTCLAIYSRCVNAREDLDQVLGRTFPWCVEWAKELRALFAAYVEAKQAQNVLDYDDLLLYWAEMTAESAIAQEIAARFDHILVDEYQDTNRLQAAILLALRPDGRGLTVVGDDAQSIYSFRAATVRNILDFPASFDPPASLITLERNYRSTAPILEAANAVIGKAKERFTKNLRPMREGGVAPRLVSVADESQQACYIADRVLDNRERGFTLKQQAVLFRTSHHSGPVELELTRRNIPYVKFGGLKFLDSAHVKDVLALLRWVQNPRDKVSGFRLLTLLPGVGPKSADRILGDLAQHAGPLQRLSDMVAPKGAAGDWPGFTRMVADVAGGATWPSDFDLALAWYEPHLERMHEDAAVRMADLRQLQQMASGFTSRERFVTDLTLDPPDATGAQAGVPMRDDDYLILSTVHSAKGQEWRSVFILNAVDGCIPSDLATGTVEEIEEERRLLYVAMTRARDDLHVVMPHRFFKHQQAAGGDRHVYAARTRFIPDDVVKRFERHTYQPPGLAGDAAARRSVRVDLKSRVRSAWT